MRTRWAGGGGGVDEINILFEKMGCVEVKGKVSLKRAGLLKISMYFLKGPKHDQVGYEFFYIKQTSMVR